MTTLEKAELRQRAVAGQLDGNLATLVAELEEPQLDYAVRWCMAKETSLGAAGQRELAAVVRELRRLAEAQRARHDRKEIGHGQ